MKLRRSPCGAFSSNFKGSRLSLKPLCGSGLHFNETIEMGEVGGHSMVNWLFPRYSMDCR